jgi:hypothetical protein
MVFHLLCASQVDKGFPDRAKNLQITLPDAPSASSWEFRNKGGRDAVSRLIGEEVSVVGNPFQSVVIFSVSPSFRVASVMENLESDLGLEELDSQMFDGFPKVTVAGTQPFSLGPAVYLLETFNGIHQVSGGSRRWGVCG